MTESTRLFARRALLPQGWAQNVVVTVDAEGFIADVEQGVEPLPTGVQALDGILVPGMPNCHSHAFQRAMAGLAENRGTGQDSFWSWRESMYHLLDRVSPPQLQAIAEQLYVEMLKQGYTAVAEFHYLHHDPTGRPFADPGEMCHRLVAAAGTAGIHITLLPVFYRYSDFGARGIEPGQRRFLHSVDTFGALLQSLGVRYEGDSNVRLGCAPHSLRAVGKYDLRELIACMDSVDAGAPVHIHIAEQRREVERCLAYNGARPVQWLLDNFEIDARWCLVHATHLDEQEVRSLAATSAVAGLCPTTEANLGDGLFPAREYLQADGFFAIGSDSQVSRDPVAELRLLEYGQRLRREQRAVLATASCPSVGEFLFRGALAGGARALGIGCGAIHPGHRADLVVLDELHTGLVGGQDSTLLDGWIFACDQTPVKDVMVAGQWRIRDTNHPREEAIADRFRQTMREIANPA